MDFTKRIIFKIFAKKREIRIDRSKAAQSRKTKVESKRKRPEGRFYMFRRNTTRCVATLHVPQEHYTAHYP